MLRVLTWLILCLVVAGGARATSVLHYTMAEAVETADVVVRGEVVSREYATLTLTDGGEMPIIRYSLKVAHCYVGELGAEGQESREVTLINPGGPIDDGAAYAPVPSGFPHYRVGEEAMLLLERRAAEEEYFVPVGLSQGRFVLTRTESGEAFASRMPLGAELIDRRTGDIVPALGHRMIWPLEDLEAEIKEAATDLKREFRDSAEVAQ